MEEGEEAAGAELKRLWSSNNAEDGTMEEEDDSDHKRAKVHSALALALSLNSLFYSLNLDRNQVWSCLSFSPTSFELSWIHLNVILFVSFRFSECRSASGISSDASGSSMERTVASSSRTDTTMFCQNFILNHGRKDDDSQVHIDLTADLLHVVYTLMHFKIIFFFYRFFCNFFFHFQVFSFLNSIDLCRSAMVCRQWRVASAHEDFWKVFNFQNMRISIKQCKLFFSIHNVKRCLLCYFAVYTLKELWESILSLGLLYICLIFLVNTINLYVGKHWMHSFRNL